MTRLTAVPWLLFSLSSAGAALPVQVEVRPPAPSLTTFSSLNITANSLSRISLPLVLSIAEAQRLCNTAPTHFHDTITKGVKIRGFDHERLELDIDRQSVTLAPLENNRIGYSIPFSGRADWHGQSHIGKVQGPWAHERLDFRGHITGSLVFPLQPDWTIHAESTPQMSIDRADLRIAKIFTISIKHKVQELVNRAAPAEGRKALDKLTDRFHFHQRAERAWTRLHISRRLRLSPPIWLNVEPVEIQVSPVRVEGQLIKSTITIAAKTIVYIKPSPPAVTVRPLPPLVLSPTGSNRFDILLPIEAEPAELLPRVNHALEGKQFTDAGVTILVSKVQTNAVADHIIIGFDFSASRGSGPDTASGRLYATARLQYEACVPWELGCWLGGPQPVLFGGSIAVRGATFTTRSGDRLPRYVTACQESAPGNQSVESRPSASAICRRNMETEEVCRIGVRRKPCIFRIGTSRQRLALKQEIAKNGASPRRQQRAAKRGDVSQSATKSSKGIQRDSLASRKRIGLRDKGLEEPEPFCLELALYRALSGVMGHQNW